MNQEYAKKISHVPTRVVVPIGVIAIVAAALSAYYGTVNSQTKTNGDINTRISVIESKQGTDEANISAMGTNVQFIHDQIIRISARLSVPTYDNSLVNSSNNQQ